VGPHTPGSRELFKEQVVASNRFLKNKSIYFIHEVPPLGRSPFECLDARPFRFKAPKRCMIDPRLAAETQAEYRKALRELEKNIRFNFLDPKDWHCDSVSCEAFLEKNRIIYRDDNHLSEAASEHFATHFIGPKVMETL
jgi:hypothetical protein